MSALHWTLLARLAITSQSPKSSDPLGRDLAAETELLPEAPITPGLAVGSAVPHAGPIGSIEVGRRGQRDDTVDITRAGPLGNPFSMGKLISRGAAAEWARRAVCAAHRTYLQAVLCHADYDLDAIAHSVGADYGEPLERVADDAAVRREVEALALKVARGDAVYLGCVCAPKECHGDALRDTILARARELRVVAAPRGPPASGSLRRLAPEMTSVLKVKPLPSTNEPPQTSPVDPPSETRTPPAPLRTSELIPVAALRELRRFKRGVDVCFDLARRGRWTEAKRQRPAALHLTEEEAILPAGRGWSWRHDPGTDLWHPITPSSWPASPPMGELDRPAILRAAAGFPDQEIVSYMVHGYPGPRLSPRCLLGPPHVGALRDFEAFERCAAKDRAKGWVTAGRSLPPVWPYCADPFNVVERHGKWRMTIDKTIELTPGVASYNDSVDLDAIEPVVYVKIADLSEASAILSTAGVPVAMFGFDFEAYFRKTGKQASSTPTASGRTSASSSASVRRRSSCRGRAATSCGSSAESSSGSTASTRLQTSASVAGGATGSSASGRARAAQACPSSRCTSTTSGASASTTRSRSTACRSGAASSTMMPP